MYRWGTTTAGSIRWRCSFCKITATRKRPDRAEAWAHSRFVDWVISKQTYTEQAQKRGVHRVTLSRQFTQFLCKNPTSQWNKPAQPVLALDAIRVAKNRLVCLIAVDTISGLPVHWMLAPTECFNAWYTFCITLKNMSIVPIGTVSDAQKGLLKALRAVFPDTPHQRCLIHLHRQACTWLTQRPKTEAGQSLLALVHALLQITNHTEAQRWNNLFNAWLETYQPFLAEKTSATAHTGTSRKWWYTHRTLRAVRTLIRNALPEIFTYLDTPLIPRTSNHVEGGINARIRELLRSHRGLTVAQRGSFTCWFLFIKQGQKPTRNVT